MRIALILLSSVLAVNAFIADSIDSNKKCLEVGALCRTNNGVVGPCCKNSYCPEPIVDISHCTLNAVDAEEGGENGRTKKKCLKPGALCAGLVGPVGKCCKGSKFVYQSPDNAICEEINKITIEIDIEDKAGKCLTAGALCSGIAGPTGTCCDGLRCVNEAPDRGICKGPKQGGLFLQDDSIFARAKCLKAGASCAGIAEPSGTCCSPLKCVYDSPDNATCKEIKEAAEADAVAVGDGACTKNGATCASANGRLLPCCDGWECVRDNPWEPEHGACYKKK